MKIDLNETSKPRSEQIDQYIKLRKAEGVSDVQLNKELKHKFHVRLKSNPTSKYTKHVGAKELAKIQKRMFEAGKEIKQTGMTATCSISYNPPEEDSK